MALKTIAKYLRATDDWGLVYWRANRCSRLPFVPLTDAPTVDKDLPTFPSYELLELVGFVDAAHATNLEDRRSITGLNFCLAGAAIAFKSKLQPTIATSLTESEFIAAVHAAKIAKYLRSVLEDLGYKQNHPTTLWEDNQAAIAMVNERRPTTRSRHIDVQFFAIQEWKARGQVQLKYINTLINPADAATKALGWTLHSRHVRRAMGHYGPPTS